MKKTYKILKFQLILLLSLTLTNSCVDNSYDLSNGVNTDITLGGDSLTFPIAKTSKIYLDSMLSKTNLDLLKKLSDGTYSLHLNDSLAVPLTGINPVSFELAPFAISPITTSFTDIKFPQFQIDPINIESSLPFPQIDLKTNIVDPINSTYTQKFFISSAFGVKKQMNSMVQKSKNQNIVIGPFRKTINQSIDQSFSYNFPAELNKIDKITLKSCVVTLTFDKTKTNHLGLISQNDTIKMFRIDFPSEFKLSTPIGLNSKIEGNSFIIENTVLSTDVDVYSASFVIESMDMSNVAQLGALIYSRTVNYSIDYSFQGTADNSRIDLLGSDVEYKVSLSASPIVDDIDIETNAITPIISGGNYSITKEIPNIPSEISSINSVNLQDGASIQIAISNPGIAPFNFTSGNCQIELPKSFVFKPYSGLNTNTNILTIPYNEIFTTKTLGISSVSVNQTIPVGKNSITLSDGIKYSINGLTLGAQKTTLNTIQSFANKTLKVTGSCNGFVVSDASLTTRSISIDIPQKTTPIAINKFVSTSVKRIYNATLKTPANLSFNVNINKLPLAIDSVFFDNFTIQLPTYLKFSTGNVNSLNQVILNRGFKVSQGFSKTLTLEKIDFGSSGLILDNGIFNLNDIVSMKGKIYIKGTNLNTKDLGTIDIIPTIQMSNISLALIEGEINPTLPSIEKNIVLNLPPFLKDAGSKIDLQNPVITLEIGNSMGIPVDASISLIPKKDGAIIPNASVNSQISILQAEVLGQTTWSRFWLAKSNDGVSNLYQPLIIPAMSNLLKIAPDEIQVKVIPTVTGNRQKFDLYSAKNQIDLKYSVNVPLNFGSDFKVHFGDTITGLKSKLVELIKYTRQLDFVSIVENNIPLVLNFEIIPLNSLKQPITGVTVTSSDSIKSCNINGTSQFSNLNFSIKEVSTGALDQLDAFGFKVYATKNSTIAGMPLKVDQYFTMELRVRIPKGIKLTLNAGK